MTLFCGRERQEMQSVTRVREQERGKERQAGVRARGAREEEATHKGRRKRD